MMESVSPGEAAQALSQIRESQTRVIDLQFTPAWYWWLIAVLNVQLAVVLESGNSTAAVIGTAVFVLAILGGTAFVVRRALHVKPRTDLLGPRGVLLILAFVAMIVGLSLGLAFTLRARDVAFPATWGMVVAGVMLVAGMPILTRRLRRIMLRNRDGAGA